MYNGKQFESNFEKSVKSEGLAPIRLYDNMQGFKSVATICDYIIFRETMFCFELKLVSKEKSFPFSRLTDTQYFGMLEQSQQGAVAGVLVLFSSLEKLFFLDIATIAFLRSTCKKSVNVKLLEELGIEIPLKKKRTNFDIFIVDSLPKMAGGAKFWQNQIQGLTLLE